MICVGVDYFKGVLMCVYSMIADHYIDKWTDKLTGGVQIIPAAAPPYTYLPPIIPPLTDDEIVEVRRLLQRAKEYDEKTNQKECELEQKKELLKKLAKELGVELTLP